MKTLVESLPEESYASLRYLITFLSQVEPHLPAAAIWTTHMSLFLTVTHLCAGISQQRGEQDDQQQPGCGLRSQPALGAGQRHVTQCHRADQQLRQSLAGPAAPGFYLNPSFECFLNAVSWAPLPCCWWGGVHLKRCRAGLKNTAPFCWNTAETTLPTPTPFSHRSPSLLLTDQELRQGTFLPATLWFRLQITKQMLHTCDCCQSHPIKKGPAQNIEADLYCRPFTLGHCGKVGRVLYYLMPTFRQSSYDFQCECRVRAGSQCYHPFTHSQPHQNSSPACVLLPVYKCVSGTTLSSFSSEIISPPSPESIFLLICTVLLSVCL